MAKMTATGVGEDDTDLMKVKQVAKRLGVSEPTVWRLIGSGELDSLKVGRSRRVAPASLDAYIASKLPASPSAQSAA